MELNKMKIAMIGHKRVPSRSGGVEVVVENLALGLCKAGFEVTVFNRKTKNDTTKSNKYTYKGIKIEEIPTCTGRALNALVYSLLAAGKAIPEKFDIIHFHALGPGFMVWLPRLFHIPTVVTIHGLDWKRAKWGGIASTYLKLAEKMCAKYADEVIVLSHEMQDYFRRTYRRETTYLPNGIECPRTLQSENVLITEKYGLKKESYILFLARIVPEKCVHLLIEAYKKIETDKKLVISGESSHSQAYFDKVKKLAEDDSRIIFTGFVQGRFLEELYQNAYVYVLPSEVEGMSVALLEAMSYGKCCLVSDIPENLEVTSDAGYSFSCGDPDDLRKKLEFLLNSPGEVKIAADIAKQLVVDQYSLEKTVRQTIKLYYSVCKKNDENIIG